MNRIFRLVIAVLGALFVALFAAFGFGAPAASATEHSCTNDTKSVLSHTWDGATGTVTITLKGDKALCDKLYVAVASYSYDTPDKGQWPQTLAGVVRGSIQNPGDVLTLTAKAVCGQRDAYADYGKEPQPGQTLTAPGKPYEPKFVHNFSKGPHTWGHDEPISCVKQPVVSPKAQLSSICEAGSASIVAVLDNSMSDQAVLYRLQVSDGQQVDKTVEAGKTEQLTLPYEGNVSVKVTALYDDVVQLQFVDKFSSANCTPEVIPPTPTAKAVISKVVCTEEGPMSYVTITNTTPVPDSPPNTMPEGTDATVVVTSSLGFKKTVTVPLGQSVTVPVPLKVGHKVTVAATMKSSGKVLAQKAITANCTTAVPPTTTPTLPQTGSASPVLAGAGFGLVAAGVIFLLATRRKPITG